MTRNKKNLYFSPESRAFFESDIEVEKCPVSKKPLLNTQSIEFIKYMAKVCPITYKEIDQEDPEIIIYDPSAKKFIIKKIKESIKDFKLDGKLIINNETQFDFLQFSSFIELKKKYEKPIYTIFPDGSYQEKR